MRRELGKDFEKNNRNKGKLIINNKKYPIESVIQINNINQNYIKMVIIRNIYNKSCMFKNCELLESLNIFSFDNNEKEIQYKEKIYDNKYNYKIKETQENGNSINHQDYSDDSYPFPGNIEKETSSDKILKENRESLKDSAILYWNNDNLKYYGNNFSILKEMFYNCKSLIFLPNIYKLDTKNVTDISSMFYNCESLSSLPDISKWNTTNVSDMNSLF